MGKVMLCDVRGPLNDLNDKLAGEAGDEWLEALKRFLRRESPWPKFSRMIRGQILGSDEALRALAMADCQVIGWANEVVEGLVWTDGGEETAFDLVVISDRELGFRSPYRTKDFVPVVRKSAYRICTPEMAIQARIMYADQPNDDCLPICMEPVLCSDGEPKILMLEHSEDLPLSLIAGRTYNGATHWPVGTRWLVGKSLLK